MIRRYLLLEDLGVSFEELLNANVVFVHFSDFLATIQPNRRHWFNGVSCAELLSQFHVRSKVPSILVQLRG